MFDIENTDTVTLGMHQRGYERWPDTASGTYDKALVHRLLATLIVVKNIFYLFSLHKNYTRLPPTCEYVGKENTLPPIIYSRRNAKRW